MAHTCRVVLPASVSRDEVDDALAALGWLLVNIVPASDRHPAQLVCLTADRAHEIHVLDDPRVGAATIVIKGEAPASVTHAIVARFPGAEVTA